MQNLLLVDDDYSLVKLLSSYLSAEGFQINSADSVSEALAIINKNKPDLIITDIMMKRLDGYDFIKLLKLDNFLVSIPIIFLTAKGMTNDRIRGYNLGCHAYLTKPFNPKELLAVIQNIFRNIDLVKQEGKSFNRNDFFDMFLSSLTFREKSILDLVVRGYMNKEIAMDLNTSLRNVEKYMTRLFIKTRTRNRIELVKFMLSSK
uniref:TctD transcriptional regulator n=1 Tax=Caloglossa intermedia TaxID=100879 RepID=A0A1Z1M709_9FLOR|nr:hypothetical protein [Caloglossa intermedia]ARW61545.1 hypothetical protein [Caloglossa intermedia]